MDTAPDDDDVRLVELGTLTAIWPEIRHPLHAQGTDSSLSRYTFELELPVQPAQPVTVLFPAPRHGQQASGASSSAPPEPVDSLLVSHLPPLSLRVTLPDGYPDRCPPRAVISTTPQWLSRETLASLEDQGARLWHEAGHDLVAYAYIDHVQRAAEDVFGAVSPEGTLEVNPAHKLAVLDYDIKAKRAAFERESFECGVCLDPKRGSWCHRMVDCGHIFCLGCLRDFYGDAIEQGNISSVRCLTPNCAKERAAAAVASNGGSSRQGRKPMTFISPGELLQIGLSGDVVKRYVTLKYKTELESDKDTIYCPRQWCNGAARSKKHKKPEGLEFAETCDGESEQGADGEEGDGDDGTGTAARTKKFNPADLLCVCEDCGFAFCGRCLQTWHGEFVRCAPRRNKDELTEEEKASLEYLQLHTSPCPTCSAPAQKTHGCNHMICSRCDTHFCYLCSSWLDPENPYQHYNHQAGGKVTSCYMRLWELEGGDGDDVGLGFHGGGADLQADGNALLNMYDADEQSDDSESDSGDDEDEDEQQQEQQQRAPVGRAGEPVAVAREAPLVLRLVDMQQPRGGGRRGGRAEQAPEPGRHDFHHDGRGAAGRGANRGRAAAAAAAAAGPQGAARGRGQNPRPQRGAPPQRAMAARGRGPGRGARARGARGRLGGGGADQQRRRRPLPPLAVGGGADALDAAMGAWVRRFVRMALVDAEDQVDEGDWDGDGDWDDDDDGGGGDGRRRA